MLWFVAVLDSDSRSVAWPLAGLAISCVFSAVVRIAAGHRQRHHGITPDRRNTLPITKVVRCWLLGC